MTTDISHTTMNTSHTRNLVTGLKVVPRTLIISFRRVQMLFSKMKTAMKSQGISFQWLEVFSHSKHKHHISELVILVESAPVDPIEKLLSLSWMNMTVKFIGEQVLSVCFSMGLKDYVIAPRAMVSLPMVGDQIVSPIWITTEGLLSYPFALSPPC
jgi:hypothetical protein